MQAGVDIHEQPVARLNLATNSEGITLARRCGFIPLVRSPLSFLLFQPQ
jgi:hypothetical protein